MRKNYYVIAILGVVLTLIAWFSISLVRENLILDEHKKDTAEMTRKINSSFDSGNDLDFGVIAEFERYTEKTEKSLDGSGLSVSGQEVVIRSWVELFDILRDHVTAQANKANGFKYMMAMKKGGIGREGSGLRGGLQGINKINEDYQAYNYLLSFMPIVLGCERMSLKASMKAGASQFMKDFLDDCNEKTKSLTELFPQR